MCEAFGSTAALMQPHSPQESIHHFDSQSHGEIGSQDAQDGSEHHTQNYFESSVLARPSSRNTHGWVQSESSLLPTLEHAEPYTQRQTFSCQGAPFPSMPHAWEARRSQDSCPFDLERSPEQHIEQQVEVENFPSGHVRQDYYTNLGEHTGNECLQLVPDANFVSSFPNDQQVYPLPVANHASIVDDKQLFFHCLEGFLSALGTSLTIPKINGVDLNLHNLYKEVTAHGGLEQVIRFKKWKEIADTMNILPNYPGASFVLRSHYLTFLFHFEQAYYFGVVEQLLPPPASLPAPIQLASQIETEPSNEVPTEPESMFKKRKRKMNPTHIFGADPSACIGSSVTGFINGKFEAGYFVTVVVGEERLTGIIYVPSDNDTQQFAYVPGLLNDLGSELEVPGLEVQLHGRKKRDSTYKKDPNAPRRTRTAYNIFYKEQRARMRQIYPNKDKKASQMIIEMWNKLSQEEKALYLGQSQQDKERYEQEMLEYRERLRLQSQVGGGGNNILTEQEMVNYDGSHDYHVTLDLADLDLQLSHSQVAGSEAHYGNAFPEHDYHMRGDELAYIPQACIPDSEIPGAFKQGVMQEFHSKFPEDQESNSHSEEPYNPDLNETACPRSEMQHFENHFAIPQQCYQMLQEGTVSKYPTETSLHGSGECDVTAASLRSHNQLEHFYAHPRKMHLLDPKLAGDASSDVLHSVASNVYQGKSDFLNGLVSQQHYHSQQQQEYPHALFPVAPESSATSEGVCNVQSASFSNNIQQHSQILQLGGHGRQVYLHQAHQGGHPYPVHIPASQAYSLAGRRPYPVCYSHGHGLSSHLLETQAVQYRHEFAPGLHRPQAHRLDVAGGSTSPSQAFKSQDTGP